MPDLNDFHAFNSTSSGNGGCGGDSFWGIIGRIIATLIILAVRQDIGVRQIILW